MSELLDSARRLAARGCLVIPLHSPAPDGTCSCGRGCGSAAKHPRTRRGLHDGSWDAQVVARWWTTWPDANIGIVTGRGSRLVVLDVDVRHDGDETLRDLEREHGRLPRTTTVVTPSGGEHYYFRHPHETVPCSAGTLGPGLDIRGDGGFVVAPPSRGINGRAYEVDERSPLAPMPKWLTSRQEVPRAVDPNTWLQMLRGGIPDGRRNTDLARLTGHLLRRYVDVDVATEMVHLVNERKCQPPLDRDEVERIIDSVAACEARRRSGT